MDELKFRYFISVAQYRSFSKVAEEYHVVPSTVSRQISLLEEELGTQLFFRDTHQVRLTKAGQRLYSHSNVYMRQFHSINEHVRNLLQQEEHRIQFATGPYEFPLAAQAVRQFQQIDPEVEIHPVLNRYDVYVPHMRSGSAVMYFAIRSVADALPELECASLGRFEWKVVARRDAPYWELPPEQQRTMRGQKVAKSLAGGIDPVMDFLKAQGPEAAGYSVAGAFNLACMQALMGRVAMLPEYMERWLPPELKMQQVFPDPLEVEAVLIFNRAIANPLDVQFFEFVRDHFKFEA